MLECNEKFEVSTYIEKYVCDEKYGCNEKYACNEKVPI